MQTGIHLIILLVGLILFGLTESRRLYQYKICNAGKCKEVSSYTRAEILFNLDSFLYSRWSPWTSCNRRECLTIRKKRCLLPLLCTDTLVQEEAFCYSRGSHCEEIYFANREQFIPDDELTEEEVVHAQNAWNGHPHVQYTHSAQGMSSVPESLRPRSEPKQTNRGKERVQEAISEIFKNFRESHHFSSPQSQSRVNSIYETYGNRVNLSNSQPRVTTPPQPMRNDLYYNYYSTPRRVPQGECGVAKEEEEEHDPNSILSRRRRKRSDWGSRRRHSRNRFTPKILGGVETKKGKWPWTVAIINNLNEVFCGGSLIAPNWVLTAAHCVRRNPRVIIGEHHLHRFDGSERHFNIKASFVHPNFDRETIDNDIALLLLPESVPDASFACLPYENQPLPSSDELCTILGWGKERNHDLFGATVLREGRVPIVSREECLYTYGWYDISANMFCAGFRSGQIDTCSGDSGGPILCPVNNRWTIHGVTSFGDGCGRQGKYGIYAQVSNYIGWIADVMRANEQISG